MRIFPKKVFEAKDGTLYKGKHACAKHEAKHSMLEELRGIAQGRVEKQYSDADGLFHLIPEDAYKYHRERVFKELYGGGYTRPWKTADGGWETMEPGDTPWQRELKRRTRAILDSFEG